MKELYSRSEGLISSLFSNAPHKPKTASESQATNDASLAPSASRDAGPAAKPAAPKRNARAMDEDNYDDDDDEDDEDEPPPPKRMRPDPKDSPAPTRPMSRQPSAAVSKAGAPPTSAPSSQFRSPEEVRKALEEEQKAAEKAAKENFLNTFFTLENDRDAMLEQQKLDELDRQVENELSGPNATSSGSKQVMGPQQGTLSSANLGASSLALKHLIARVDANRDRVPASDAKLRSLMKEVRKNRSKWANEDRVGQEELYEAAERVLMDLKGQTEHATPFLQRVNRRDAPDYHKIITKPMDIGTMIKKLKGLEYKSKKEFCDDLELIWTNCLKYNADPAHYLRKKAEHMRKETARLTPLIPDITIRDRAEVEAAEKAAEKAAEREERERKRQLGDIDSDEDDQPIVATRGRKAPSKGAMKGGTTARKAPPTAPDQTQSPAPDISAPAPATGLVRADHLRADGEGSTDQPRFSTEPPGNSTPLPPNLPVDSTIDASHADVSEVEAAPPAAMDTNEEQYEEDEEYKVWKHVTKKERAQIAADRHRLFAQDRLNAEEPALLRTKAGMRRWVRLQKKLMGDLEGEEKVAEESHEPGVENATATGTLAEGMDIDDDSVLPDYYFPLSGVPEVNPRLKWTEDHEGNVVEHREECMHFFDADSFQCKPSLLTKKMESNMRQMQETRKIMARIGMVKQMQVQTQTYQNQFQKYEPEPFREATIPPTVVTDDGPMIAPGLMRATLQRSIGKIFYHAGFEDFQPSALDTVTELAIDHFSHLSTALKSYFEAPAVTTEEIPAEDQPFAPDVQDEKQWTTRYDMEDSILQTLQSYGHDLDSLTSYIEEDITRIGTKLSTHHENVKQYYADLVRPALDPTLVAYDGGASAFNDGNESQFIAGDFAEDLGEDFFGFRELGLDKELGLSSVSVPLHLLQSRINASQPTVGTGVVVQSDIMENPEPWRPVTSENIEEEIGLVQTFFKEKLDKMPGDPLIEDEDLPAKQRFPKPRLPPTGKISSPRKRPLREQQMMARKRRRMEIEAERERERENNEGGAGASSNSGGNGKTADSSMSASRRQSEAAPTSNGGANNGDANGIPDEDAAHEADDVSPSKPPPTAKSAAKPKLEPSSSSANNAKSGDPEKKGKGKGDNNDGAAAKGSSSSGANKGNNNGKAEQDAEGERDDGGMLGRESVPIAAH